MSAYCALDTVPCTLHELIHLIFNITYEAFIITNIVVIITTVTIIVLFYK